MQLTSDGNRLYLSAVEDAFGADIDYAMLVKYYGDAPQGQRRYSPAVCTGATRMRVTGDPDESHISTSYVERQNLTMRMSMRCYTRLTNAFSKKVENHAHALALYYVWYNFCRVHKTLRVTPAMEAGITNTVHDVEWIVGLIDARVPQPRPTRTIPEAQAGCITNGSRPLQSDNGLALMRRAAFFIAVGVVITINLLPAFDIHIVPESIRRAFHFRYNIDYVTEFETWKGVKDGKPNSKEIWSRSERALYPRRYDHTRDDRREGVLL